MDLDIFQTPQQLEEWMHQQHIVLAEPSTSEYYKNNKDTSFPINLDSDIRGQAIVFVMTRRRRGWQNETWNLFKMFKAINAEAEFVYDATALTIERKLLKFSTDERTKNADIIFIAFCGHGCSKDGNMHDIHLTTGDVDFNIWPGCQYILSKRNCEIKEKPKVFIVQACRDPDQRHSDRNINNETQQDVKYIRKPASLQEYMFVFATQPGEVAHRSHFIAFSSELVIKNSGKNKLQDILTTQLTGKLKSYCNQSPQCSTSMTNELNIFPWITTDELESSPESDLAYPVQESETNHVFTDSDSVNSRDKESNPTGNNHSRNRLVDLSVFYLLPMLQFCLNILLKTWRLATTIPSKAKGIIFVHIQCTGPANSAEEKAVAQKTMLRELCEPENTKRLEENLSDDLDSKVSITKVIEGSINIHITLEDEEALDTLVFMSDTGLLSYKMQVYLVTPEYLNSCKIERVKIKATVKSPIKSSFLEDLVLECQIENNDLSIKCPFLAKNKGIWFKDGSPLELTNRHTICLNDGKPEMKIVKTTMQDRGRYKCEYTGLDNRIHIMECSVLVFPFSEPTNVHVDEDPISGHPGVKVTWLPGPGRNSGYIVRYWDSMENVKEQKTQNTSLRLGNLTPGTEYWFTVFSTWQGVESGNSETVRIKTGYPR